MAFLSFGKTEEPPATAANAKWRSTLEIAMSDRSAFSWCSDDEDRAKADAEWDEFRGWFSGAGEPIFVIRWKDGEMGIKRDDIRRYRITTERATDAK